MQHNKETNNNIYLTKKRKEYYYNDFIENVLTEKDKFWSLNDSIRQYLIELNECENIQSLYSSFPTINGSDNSHITFTYSKHIELAIFRKVIPPLIIRFNNNLQLNRKDKFNSNFVYVFYPPSENANFIKGNSKFKMGSITNPNYFKINNLRFNFECDNNNHHIDFWEDMINELKIINKTK